ncbi:hypothetical protein SBRY_30565 [Actinacidiphila bryophytorum]|uniref:Uncharacterized protein n=1 Tax=Actinacidiphila bryophytorum TaxID=1436133 RepID=A0A9W4H179_9ACTN|nr:hypothetical protein SBRY_30565 [Actinacidiphila bryophytorum]
MLVRRLLRQRPLGPGRPGIRAVLRRKPVLERQPARLHQQIRHRDAQEQRYVEVRDQGGQRPVRRPDHLVGRLPAPRLQPDEEAGRDHPRQRRRLLQRQHQPVPGHLLRGRHRRRLPLRRHRQRRPGQHRRRRLRRHHLGRRHVRPAARGGRRQVPGRAELLHNARHPAPDLGLQRPGQPAMDPDLLQRTDGHPGRHPTVPGRREQGHHRRHQGGDLVLQRPVQPAVAAQLQRHDHRRPVRPVPRRHRRLHGQRRPGRTVDLQRPAQPTVDPGIAQQQQLRSAAGDAWEGGGGAPACPRTP